MTQAEIDAREIARVEALLQLCAWLVPEDDPLDPDDTGLPHIHVACAIQHDLIEDILRRQHVVMEALDTLAERWELLPSNERDVVLAGFVDNEKSFWDGDACLSPHSAFRSYLVPLAHRLAGVSRDTSPESRTYAEREYARMLRMITNAVIGA